MLISFIKSKWIILQFSKEIGKQKRIYIYNTNKFEIVIDQILYDQFDNPAFSVQHMTDGLWVEQNCLYMAQY